MACLDDALARRLVTLRLGLGTAVATPSAVVDRCNGLGKTPVHVVFRDDIEPRSATLQVGQQRVLLIAQPAGSGSRDATESPLPIP